MGIWIYNDLCANPPGGRRVETCYYCNTNLANLRSRILDRPSLKDTGDDVKRVDACPSCGWWVLSFSREDRIGTDWHQWIHRAAGTLRCLDVSDVALPTEELRRYLLAKYDDRLHVHPRKYEEVVASVFRDFGYSVRVTSYSGDDGIDVFVFDGDRGDVVGIQVKRTRNNIQADQIREFAGSLILNGVTRGIFVTTETFTRGAARTASQFETKRVAIELWDAAAFYDKLRLTTRAPYEFIEDPDAPFASLWKNPQRLPEVFHDSAGYG